MLAAGLALSFARVSAQEGEEKGFKLENLFTGGSITASFFNGQTVLGATPHFGYKLADWVDAGVVFNINYTGTRDYYYYGDKVRQTVYGPGAFTRLYPVRFLFAQAQFEHNFSQLKYFPPGSGTATQTLKADANSLLLGAGFAQGRERGNSTFFYISLLFDVLKDVNSPYVNVAYNPNDLSAPPRVDIVPIIRAGFNIGLFQHRYGKY